jgi:pimeloyl-ACP methyl ester carboxylesterase
MREHLTRADVVTLDLPGFATPVPEGFDATKEAYTAWIVAALDGIGEPVDLVGHDWGGLLVQRVASERPDLVRTLATGSGVVDVEYEWHEMARAWQTPGVGEQIIEGWLGMSADERTAGLVAGGCPAALAAIEARNLDRTMAECILALYRSAVDVGKEWQPGVESMPHRPAMVLWGRDDPFVTPRFAERLADRLGAELVLFDGCGHWWPFERARETASALERLWND